MREKHSRPSPEGRAFWWTDRLWILSADLPVHEVDVGSIPELDMDCWFMVDQRRAGPSQITPGGSRMRT